MRTGMTWGILAIAGTLALSGCKTKVQYVPVESVRTEYQDRIIRDSIYQQDSVYFAIKGDTVYLEKYRTLYKDRLLRDSVIVQDTIRVPYPVDKVVEVNRLHWYQEALMWIGVGALVVLMLWLVKRKG